MILLINGEALGSERLSLINSKAEWIKFFLKTIALFFQLIKHENLLKKAKFETDKVKVHILSYIAFVLCWSCTSVSFIGVRGGRAGGGGGCSPPSCENIRAKRLGFGQKRPG